MQKYPNSNYIDFQVSNIEYLQSVSDKRIESFTIEADSNHIDETVVNDILTMVNESPGNTQLYFQIHDSESNNTVLLRSRTRPITVKRELVNYVESHPNMTYKVN